MKNDIEVYFRVCQYMLLGVVTAAIEHTSEHTQLHPVLCVDRGARDLKHSTREGNEAVLLNLFLRYSWVHYGLTSSRPLKKTVFKSVQLN